MNWPSFKIKDLCDITSSKRIYAKDYLPEGVPFYRGKEIIEKYNGAVEISTQLFISPNKYEEIKSKFGVPQYGDILLSSVGTLGVPFQVNNQQEFYFKDGNLTWFRNFKEICSRYLYYWLVSPEGKMQLQKCTIGTSQSAYTIVRLKEMEISLPPQGQQEDIASILSAYDDLIENNRRRIQLLEESARLLYKEWFVHLRFPGHEHTKIIDGIPEGWERKTLGECATLNYGKALKKDNRIEGNFLVYGSSGVVGFHNKAIVKSPAIIIGRKGNVGSVFWSVCDCWPIDTVYFILPEESNLYLYYALINMTFINTDVAVPGLNRDFAYSRPIMMPKENIKAEFNEKVGLIRKQIDKLEQYNQKLAQARDLLLPRLMNGEIEV